MVRYGNRQVYAFDIPRAADGSAFTKCTQCGRSVAISLYGIHQLECRAAPNRKLLYARRAQAKRPRIDDGGAGAKPSCPVIISDSDDNGIRRGGNRKTKPGFPVFISDNNDGGTRGGGNGKKKKKKPSAGPFSAVLQVVGYDKEKSGVFDPSQPPTQGDWAEKSGVSADEDLAPSTPAPRSDGLDLSWQPRSAFRFFMESYEKACGLQDWLDIDRTGFEKWKSMSSKERKPFVDQSKKVSSAYNAHVCLVDNKLKVWSRNVVDGDSSLGEKAPKSLKCDYWGAYERSRSRSINTYEWEKLHEWGWV